VPGLPQDVAIGLASARGRGGEAGAERVPGEGRHVEADRLGGALHHQGNGAIGEARSSDASMPIDSAKNGALGNAGGLEPGTHGAHGADLGRGAEGDRDGAPAALLVGLVAAERDGDPLGRGEEQIGDVERDEGGAANPAGPAEEQQRPIAGSVERRRQRGGGL
jgi:hypothetical protein